MVVRVIISDTSFNILEILDNEYMGLTWSYNRIGGCGSFSFDLPRNFCDEKYISGDFNIKIYVRDDDATWDLWYQGLVEDKVPNINGGQETIKVSGHGYQSQLSRIYLDGVNYTTTEVSAIIANIIQTYIEPYTDIIYDASLITATTFSPSTITFNTDAQSAISTLADIVGTREYGVNSERKFFFKARSSTTGFRFPLGGKITAFNSDDSFKDIINRVIVQGGDVAGVPYTVTFNDTTSQLKYNRRDQVITNSSITTSDVATQLATSIFAEKSDVVRRARVSLADYETQVEATIPIPLMSILTRRPFYGEKYYGTFLYSGEVTYQVNSINYKLSDVGSMVVDIDAGKPRPDISETIGQITYELEQLRSATL